MTVFNRHSLCISLNQMLVFLSQLCILAREIYGLIIALKHCMARFSVLSMSQDYVTIIFHIIQQLPIFISPVAPLLFIMWYSQALNGSHLLPWTTLAPCKVTKQSQCQNISIFRKFTVHKTKKMYVELSKVKFPHCGKTHGHIPNVCMVCV